MQHITNQTHKLLIKSKKTIAIAESCTGGLTSKLLTDIPGSSRYFIAGIIAYSNEIKTSILKIPVKIILQKGAVSKKVACYMAQSIRKIAKADFGLGITGIAGPSPSGGSLQKPIGTVFIAIENKNKKICKKFLFKGSRLTIRRKAALKALELLTGAIYNS